MGEEENPEKERKGIPCFLLRYPNPYWDFNRYWKGYRPLYLPTFSLQAIAGAPLLESLQTPTTTGQENLPTVE